MGNIFENELNLILKEYSADYTEENPADLTVYLSITPEIHYQVQVNFKTYPERPSINLPPDLTEELGDPANFLFTLRDWDSKKPPHIVDIIHELEEIFHRIIYPNDEMEEVMAEFNAQMIAPFKLQVSLYSYKMKTYDFQIIHKKPNPPFFILSPPLEKIIKPEELDFVQKWPAFRLIDICRDLSKKIDNRVRILDELKQLDQRREYQKIIHGPKNQELLLDIRIEIETEEYCELSLKLNEEFPVAPPEIEIKSVSNTAIQDELNEFLLSQYNQWQNANTIVEILDDVKSFLKQKSKLICQICHQYKCPRCGKPIITKLRGISGETECKSPCTGCHANFHRCCLNEQLKLTRKCPICMTPRTVFL